MLPLCKGRYIARLAGSEADVRAAQALRHRCFRAARGLAGGQLDHDAFDDRCLHVLIEDRESGALLGCYRLLLLPSARELGHSYAGQFYDLAALAGFPGPVLELGRFCIDAACTDPDVLRIAWGAMTRVVDGQGVTLLFGCTSFDGTDPAPHAEALGLLASRHLAPAPWRPGRRADETVPLPDHPFDAKRAMAAMPPLLRTYLGMGGWVSDHAVIDRDLQTLHVFTGVEIAAIPAARARLLRAVAS